MMQVYIPIQVKIENDARINFQNAAYVALPPSSPAGGRLGARSTPGPPCPSSPATAYVCQRPEGFALQPVQCCWTLTKHQGWFGVHWEGLAITGCYTKAYFLGGASYQFCSRFPQRCTEKKEKGKLLIMGNSILLGL